METSEIVFFIECAQNFDEAIWHTHNIESKYEDTYKAIMKAITDRIPNAIVLKNTIPKCSLPIHLRTRLLPDQDENSKYFRFAP